MSKVNVYLNFNGNTEEVFNFYKSIFGGEFASFMRFKDTEEAGKFSKLEQEKIMHVALPIGQGNVLMGSDIIESQNCKLNMGNNFYLSINTESKQETERIFNALSAGGQIETPLQDTFWGAYFGMVADKFGIQWMISFEKKA